MKFEDCSYGMTSTRLLTLRIRKISSSPPHIVAIINDDDSYVPWLEVLDSTLPKINCLVTGVGL